MTETLVILYEYTFVLNPIMSRYELRFIQEKPTDMGKYRVVPLPGKEGVPVTHAFALDEMRLKDGKRKLVFSRMLALCADKYDMVNHLNAIQSYQSTQMKKRRWYDDKVTRPTHVIIAWDDAPPKIRTAMHDSPYNLVTTETKESILSTFTCFMFYRNEPPNINLLNWHHGSAREPDFYLPHLRACVADLKKKYLLPFYGIQTIRAEILPILETLVWFSVGMGFTMDNEDDNLRCQFVDAFLLGDIRRFQRVIDDKRYHSVNSEGATVIKLRVESRICDCTLEISKSRPQDALLINAFQCTDCCDVVFCMKQCPYWLKKRECYCCGLEEMASKK